jgi:hypothetical protein
MKPATRSIYANYIADVIRNTTAECGFHWPARTIIVAKSYIELADIDEIVGIKIFIGDFPAQCDFFFSIPAPYEDERRLLRAAREYMDIHSMDFDEQIGAVPIMAASATSEL